MEVTWPPGLWLQSQFQNPGVRNRSISVLSISYKSRFSNCYLLFLLLWKPDGAGNAILSIFTQELKTRRVSHSSRLSFFRRSTSESSPSPAHNSVWRLELFRMGTFCSTCGQVGFCLKLPNCSLTGDTAHTGSQCSGTQCPGCHPNLCFQLPEVIGSPGGMGLLPWSSSTLPCFWSPLSSEDPKPYLTAIGHWVSPSACALHVCGFA